MKRFFSNARRSPLPAAALAVLALSGCGGVASIIMGPASNAPVLKARVESFQRDESIDRAVSEAVAAALKEPGREKDLRGVSVSAAVASLGRGDKREAPKIGGYLPELSFEAGTLDSLVYAFYYASKAEDDDSLARDARIGRTVREAFRTRSRRGVNEALDLLSGTSSGDALEGAAFAEFKAKRFLVNDWLADIGLGGAGLKTGYKKFENDLLASARDNQLKGPSYSDSNEASAFGVAKLLALASYKDLFEMETRQRLLSDLSASHANPGTIRDNAVGNVLPSGTRMWGTASVEGPGYHVAMLFQTSGGNEYVIAILTDSKEHGQELAKLIAARLASSAVRGEFPIPRKLSEN